MSTGVVGSEISQIENCVLSVGDQDVVAEYTRLPATIIP